MPFKKGKSGNPKGKPKGIKAQKTVQWEALRESIIGEQADNFSKFLNKLWKSDDPADQMKASTLYLQTIEYFKPKQSRVESVQDGPVEVIVKRE